MFNLWCQLFHRKWWEKFTMASWATDPDYAYWWRCSKCKREHYARAWGPKAEWLGDVPPPRALSDVADHIVADDGEKRNG